MKYISLAAYKNELIVVENMDVFTSRFCYAKRQRQGAVDINVPPVVEAGDADESGVPFEPEGVEIADEDDLLT